MRIIIVCAYCMDEYKREKRLDVGYKILEVEMADGQMHSTWLYHRPDHDASSNISHGMCPTHFKLEMVAAGLP